jgi:hypothetical protein
LKEVVISEPAEDREFIQDLDVYLYPYPPAPQIVVPISQILIGFDVGYYCQPLTKLDSLVRDDIALIPVQTLVCTATPYTSIFGFGCEPG